MDGRSFRTLIFVRWIDIPMGEKCRVLSTLSQGLDITFR